MATTASKPSDLLAFQLKSCGIAHEREFWFHKRPRDADICPRCGHLSRKWRFDFLIDKPIVQPCSSAQAKEGWSFERIAFRLAVEIEGISPTGTRHQRIGGFRKDCEKYEAALLHRFVVYRVLPAWVKSGRALKRIEQFIGEAA